MKKRLALGCLTILTLAAGCEQAPSEATRNPAHGPMATAARAAAMKDRALIHQIVRATTSDARKNSASWFGDRKRRTPASACNGITRLIAKHMAAFDSAKQRPRSNKERAAAAAAIVKSAGCGLQKPMSMFARNRATVNATMLPRALPDSVDDWLAANWHPDSWSVAVEDYTTNGPGPIDPYIGGMTEFEVANMEVVSCAQSFTIEELGVVEEEEEGEDPMMMYFWPAWSKAALIGCGASVIAATPEIAAAVRTGFFWGPWGAVAVGTAVALEYCVYGAIAGYYVWKLT